MSSAPAPRRIDRASHLRRDTDRLMAALDAPSTRLVPVQQGKHFLRMGAEPRAALPSAAEGSALIDRAAEIVWLGRLGDDDCFALDLPEASGVEAHPALAGSELSDLRLSAGLLAADEAELLAYARGMLNWHRTHRFCGSCGKPTVPREGGHVRLCEAEDLKHFPRTDPAVMVIVTRGDRCVVARQPGWPKGMWSVVAGFVEPGETMEAAAAREVAEELGLRVAAPSYFRSQPWPFPSSLMVGFRAEALADELVVDRDELEDARWVTREELRRPEGWFYPPPHSLAHHLIQEFLESAP